MLRPKILPKILEQANTGGVKHTLLLTNDGSLLASASTQPSLDTDTIGAIVTNIWQQYQNHSTAGDAEYLLIECEDGKVVATKVAAAVLCIVGDNGVHFGMLKHKAQLLRQHMEEPLSQVSL